METQSNNRFTWDTPQTQSSRITWEDEGRYSWTSGKEDGDSSLWDNFAAGWIHGAGTESFSASGGNIVQSWMDSDNPAAGYLFAKNRDTGEREFYQPPHVYAGITQEQWDNMSEKDRRITMTKEQERRLNSSKADKDSWSYMAGRFLGILTDPTTLLPLGWGGLATRSATSAAVGAADMAAYTASQEGEVNLGKTAAGAALGAVVPPALTLAGKGVKGAGRGVVAGSKAVAKGADNLHAKLSVGYKRKQADLALQSIEKDIAAARLDPNIKSSFGAFRSVIKSGKYTPEQIRGLEEKSGRSISSFGTTADAEGVQHLLAYQADTPMKEFRRKLNEWFVPMTDRLERLSPRLTKLVRDHYSEIQQWVHRLDTKVDPFTNRLNKLFHHGHPSVEARRLWLALNNTDKASLRERERLIRTFWGEAGIKDYKDWQKADELLFRFKVRAGLLKPNEKLEGHFPRYVVDYKRLLATLGQEEKTFLQKVIDAAKVKNPELTADEINDIANKYLSGKLDTDKYVRELASAKERRIIKITDKMLDAYSLPGQAVHSDIRHTMENIARRKLFGKVAIEQHGDDVVGGVGAFTQKLVNEGKIRPENMEEIKSILTTLFTNGTRKPSRVVQALKDLTYTTTIFNFRSAVTQFSDISFGMFRNGIKNTTDGLIEAATGHGLTPKAAGYIDHMVEEFVSTGWSRRVSNIAAKGSLFRATDALGKTSIMNGALKRFTRMVEPSKGAAGIEKFRAIWGEALGSDFDLVVKDLQRLGTKGWKTGQITKRLRDLVYAEVSDFQPTNMAEMPQWYANHPDGRFLYILKSFALKHMHVWKRDVFRKLKNPATRTEGAVNMAKLVTYYTAAGMTTDAIKKAMIGDEPDIDSLAWDNLLKNIPVLGDRFTLEKSAVDAKPGTRLLQAQVPPVIFDPIFRAGFDLLSGDTDRLVEKDWMYFLRWIPFFGAPLEAGLKIAAKE